jgi:hypothetical protein
MEAPVNISVGILDAFKRQYVTIEHDGDYAYLFEAGAVVHFACPRGEPLGLFDLTEKNILDNRGENRPE